MNKARNIKQVNADNYMTVEEASRELGIKSPVLRNYLYQGKLTTYKFKTLTLLSAKEVRNWQGNRKR